MIDRDDPAAPADVVLVEPSPDGRRLTTDGFSAGGSESTLHVVEDGTELLEFLHRRGEYATAPRPNLVLLSLDLPGEGGEAVLGKLKGEAEFARIPVVVYGHGVTTDEVRRLYERFANAYVATPKTSDSDAFVETMRRVRRFWVAAARLPDRAETT